MKYLLIPIVVFFCGCNSPDEVEPNASLNLSVPANLASGVPQPDYNLATGKGVLLGKMLFYDPLLSGNNTISCASCHLPHIAFADTGQYSKGENGKIFRNTPPLFNLAWHNGYFWDGGAKNLESQVFAPLQSPDEMNQDLNILVNELKNHPQYPLLFRQAFGKDSITTSQIAWAIAQFERSLISANSKYDKYVRNEAVTFDVLEIKGLQLFKEKCTVCHKTDFFTDFDYHNNGLDSNFDDGSHENIYKGRYRITYNPADIGKYKTPSLRNISHTAPYMHDGRFKTLEQVIDHYSNGIVHSKTLDAYLRFNDSKGFGFTKDEKNALLAFLNTLTDDEFMKKTDYASPY